ncbi:reverse transcriptase domain, reverse transcriptase zinc-binding domain protein, partial [Tanacetum coccineum]
SSVCYLVPSDTCSRSKRSSAPGGGRCSKKRKKSHNGSYDANRKRITDTHKDGSSKKKMKRRSFKLAKVVVSQKRRYWSIKGNSCDSKGHGLSEAYKVTHTEVSSIGKNDAIAGNLEEVQSSSLSREKIRQVGGTDRGEIISLNIKGLRKEGKKWWVQGIHCSVGPDVLTLQETQCAIIDEFWIKEVWGNRNVGYVKMEAKGRSRGMVMMWDNNMFSCLEAVGEERFIAVRVDIPMGGRRFTWISDDGLKFSKLDWFLVSEEFKNKWSSLSAIALDRKLLDHCPIMLKDIDMDFGPKPFKVYDMWLEEVDIEQVVHGAWDKEELEAETRMLEDNEVAIWLEERRAWIEKDRKRANMLKQKIRVTWDVEGDENSKFFHSMIKRRNNKSNIRGLMVDGICSEKKEIWDAISCCGGEKTPGPDGFNFKFIKRFWSIFRPDKVGKMVLGNKGDIEELSASTSILVNGSPTDDFRLEHGIWQGDPFLPFLFIIAAEGLNARVREAISKGLFKGISIGDDDVVVSHLQYADDTVFFGEWNVENARVLMCILKCFEEVSRLKVNLNKSRVYGVGVSQNEIEGMARWMGCCVGEFPFTYLGLPIGLNMKRVSAWRPVVEKVKKRFLEWRAKSMSFGGRLMLVKSVLGSLSLYFFLNVSSARGLNIRSLRGKNWALLGKWWWRFRVEGNAFWVKVIRSIYGSDGGLGSVSTMKEACGCGVWGDIVRVGLDLDKLGIGFINSFCRRVGDGWDTYFWADRWRGDMCFKDRFTRLYHLDSRKEAKVAEKGEWVEGIWKWKWEWVREPRGRANGEVEDLISVLGDFAISCDCRDSWTWLLEDKGRFTVKALSKMMDNKYLHEEDSRQETVWNKIVPKKVNIFIWRALKGRLPVRSELDKRGIDLDSVIS